MQKPLKAILVTNFRIESHIHTLTGDFKLHLSINRSRPKGTAPTHRLSMWAAASKRPFTLLLPTLFLVSFFIPSICEPSFYLLDVYVFPIAHILVFVYAQGSSVGTALES